MFPRKEAVWLVLGILLLLLGLGSAVWSAGVLGRSAWAGLVFNPGAGHGAAMPGPLRAVPVLRPGAVTRVFPGSPADRAGIRVMDRVVEVGGIPAHEAAALHRLSSNLGAGDGVAYRVERQGEFLDVAVRLDSPLRSAAVSFSLLSSYAIGLVFGGIGLFVYLERPLDRSACLFYLMSALVTVMFVNAPGFTHSPMTGIGLNDPTVLGAWFLATLAVYVVVTTLLWPLVVHFSLVFPRRRPSLERHARLLFWLYGLPVVLLLLVPALLVYRSALSRIPGGWDGDLVVLPGLGLAFLAAAASLGGAVRSLGAKAGLVASPGAGLTLLAIGTLMVHSAGEVITDVGDLSGPPALFLSLAVPAALGLLFFVVVLILYPVASCVALYRNYREGNLEERAQVRWPLWGSVVSLAGAAALGLVGTTAALWLGGAGSLTTILLEGLSKALYVAIPVSFAFAILKYRLMEIDPVVGKTLVYSALAGAILACYLALAAGIGGLSDRAAAARYRWVVVAATVGVAAVLLPLRGRVQRLVDRRLSRRRPDGAQALRNLTAGLSAGADRPGIGALIADQVQRVVPSRAVAVFLRREGERALTVVAKIGLPDDAVGRLAIPGEGGLAGAAGPVVDVAGVALPEEQRRALREVRASLFVPIRRTGRPVGAITVGAKLSGRPVDREDTDFLAAVAERAAVAIDDLDPRGR